MSILIELDGDIFVFIEFIEMYISILNLLNYMWIQSDIEIFFIRVLIVTTPIGIISLQIDGRNDILIVLKKL